MFARLIALLMSVPLSLTLSAAAHAQTPVTGQTTQEQSLQEEMRQIRKLIERQEARIRRLEAEKSVPAAKPTPTTDRAAPAREDTSPAAPGNGQANPPGAASKNTSNQGQASKDASKNTSKDNSKDTSKDASKLSTDDRETLDFWRDTTASLTGVLKKEQNTATLGLVW